MKILLLVNYWPEQVSYISDLAITVCSRPSESESAELNNYWYRNTHIPAVGGTCVFPDLNPNRFNMLLTISYNMYSSGSTTKKKKMHCFRLFFKVKFQITHDQGLRFSQITCFLLFLINSSICGFSSRNVLYLFRWNCPFALRNNPSPPFLCPSVESSSTISTGFISIRFLTDSNLPLIAAVFLWITVWCNLLNPKAFMVLFSHHGRPMQLLTWVTAWSLCTTAFALDAMLKMHLHSGSGCQSKR